MSSIEEMDFLSGNECKTRCKKKKGQRIEISEATTSSSVQNEGGVFYANRKENGAATAFPVHS
jgi:hypothetical protein